MEGVDLVETAREVRVRRASTGMSQDDLAAAADVGRSTVQKIERGERVRLKSLLRVLNALDHAEKQLHAAGYRAPISIDEFLAQDPNLDDDTRAHFRKQYDLLIGLTRWRRSVADVEAISDVEGRRPGVIDRILRNADGGKPPPPGNRRGSVTRESEGDGDDGSGRSAAG